MKTDQISHIAHTHTHTGEEFISTAAALNGNQYILISLYSTLKESLS